MPGRHEIIRARAVLALYKRIGIDLRISTVVEEHIARVLDAADGNLAAAADALGVNRRSLQRRQRRERGGQVRAAKRAP